MITYVKGDATKPNTEGKKYIVHCCNNVGLWGKGFVLAISKKWKEPEARFRREKNPKLGEVQFVKVEDDITVINLFGQNGVKNKNNPKPVDYFAIQEGFFLINKQLEMLQDSGIKVSVHMPRIGCGLAGGEWSEIEKILRLFDNLDYFVYDL